MGLENSPIRSQQTKEGANLNATIPLAPDSYATDRRPVAPLWHTVGLLLFLALITYGGVRTHGTTATAAPATNLVRLYLTVIAGEWMLVLYVWRGIRRRGVTLRELIGGNLSVVSAFGRNLAIAVLFWFVCEGSARAMHLLLGTSDTANVTAMLPRTSVQIVVWCLVSCTAGFCEEVLYRGYLQRQFAAWTGSASSAIAIQAAIFGASHGYQGTKQMIIISVLGALYGILAHWRRTLLPGMAAHAWSDIYGGWLHP
jgi:membrane protease YdiL (CAAX protease family)